MLISKHKQPGFTVVELLVVIVVIAILAAVAVVAFSGTQQRAIETALKSDLNSGAKLLGMENATEGSYPTSLEELDGGAGFGTTSGTNYQYTYTPVDNSYCLSATSDKIEAGYHIVNGGTAQEGVCSGHTEGGGGGSSATTYELGDTGPAGGIVFL